jgi:hypothetical protein
MPSAAAKCWWQCKRFRRCIRFWRSKCGCIPESHPLRGQSRRWQLFPRSRWSNRGLRPPRGRQPQRGRNKVGRGSTSRCNTPAAVHRGESESCFEDFGRAERREGRADVARHADFAALVDVENYHVFLTAEGESSGLYVNARTPGIFEVRELANGRSTLEFSYRIVERR